ncbi:MAG: DUF2283 domain-containing protein [Pseudobdellovibrionaceae bacterium]
MRIEYYKDTDSLYIELADRPSKSTVEISEFINADLDENNELVGLDIHSNASKFKFDELEFKNIPQIKNIKFG